MATIIIDNKHHDIPDGEKIETICESAGVPFNCHSGNCGTCHIEIIEGHDNLCELNHNEKDMGMGTHNRLACQTRIKSGIVKIVY